MKDDLTFEKALDFMAILIIGIGILLTLYCLYTMVMVENTTWYGGLSTAEKLAYLDSIPSGEYRDLSETSKTFSLFGLAYSIGVFLSAILTGVLLRVISNISKNLFEVNRGIKEFKFVYLGDED